MRLLIASVAAFAAVAFAAPSFAQEAARARPDSAAKPKPGTSAYCNTLKSSTSKSSCLKRVHASAKAPHKAAKAKKVDPAKTDTSRPVHVAAGHAGPGPLDLAERSPFRRCRRRRSKHQRSGELVASR